jgi:hypothetical protein
LERQGFLESAADQSGTYTAEVGSAINAWQSSLDQPLTFTVTKRSFVAIDGLPARLVTSVPVGTSVAGDDLVGQWFDDATFTVQVGGNVRSRLRDGMAARVSVDGQEHAARIEGLSIEPTGEANLTSDAVVVTLVRGDGSPGPVCGDTCVVPKRLPSRGSSETPGAASTITNVELIVAEPVTGPVVPGSAIGVDESGATFVVVDGSSDRTPVTVLAVADGQAVVSGVDAGTRVLALAPQ